jgi:hypothetical protein
MFLIYLHILNPIIGLATNVLVQVVGFRFVPNLGLLKSVILGFVIGLLSLFFLESYIFFLKKEFLPTTAVNLFIYLSLGYCYFHFINLGETARRIRILRELYDSKRGLSMKEILERYNAGKVIEMRLERLLKNGQVVYKNSRYYIGKPIMLLITKILVLMKLIILGKSEFV